MLINLKFKEIIIEIIRKNKLFKKYDTMYPNKKYNLSEILDGIIYVLKSGISWRNFNGNIKWQSLNYHFNILKDSGIFLKAYKKILKTYQKLFKSDENIILTDTTFIKNNIGIKRLGRNKYFKNKKCFKVSFMTDINGIPFDILVGKGNKSEVSYLSKHIERLFKSRFKETITLLADKGYDSSNIRESLLQKNIKPIIPYNHRNTKDPTKFKYLTPAEEKIYNKRIKIEHSFSWLKKNKRISEVNEKNYKSYLNFIYLACSLIIFNRINE